MQFRIKGLGEAAPRRQREVYRAKRLAEGKPVRPQNHRPIRCRRCGKEGHRRNQCPLEPWSPLARQKKPTPLCECGKPLRYNGQGKCGTCKEKIREAERSRKRSEEAALRKAMRMESIAAKWAPDDEKAMQARHARLSWLISEIKRERMDRFHSWMTPAPEEG